MTDAICGKTSGPQWFTAPDAFGTEYTTFLLEQYKVFVDSANKVSDRRGTAHTLLLTVNTSLVTIYGFVLGKDAVLATAKGPWIWLVPVAGLLVSIAWLLLIRSYRTLNEAKFRVIHEIEKRLPGRLFELEWEFLSRGKGWSHVPLTHIERYIPLVFAALYVALLVVAWRSP